MLLLGAVLYDPSTAANKSTAAAAVMAVLDTTNLTLAVTVPASGIIRVVMRTVIDGAATFPQILLGVMNHTGGAVLGRVSPIGAPSGTALATTHMPVTADFLITGLAAGALQLDAAFGVEFGVTSSAIRWGGPNNTVASDAWGAFQFEIWDPKPFTFTTAGKIDASVRDWVGDTIPARNTTGVPIVDTKYLTGTLQTARDIGASVLLAAGQKVDVDTIKTNPVVNAGTVTFPTGATLASTTNITAGVIGSVSGAVGSVTGLTASDVGAIKTKTDSLTFTGAGKVDASVRDWVGDTIPARSVTGVPKVDVQDWVGGAVPAVNVTGVPLVDLKYTLGTISPATAGSVRADAVTGAVGSVTGAVGSVTGAVGSVTGAVGSVTGAVGSVTGAVGSVTGNIGGLTAAGWATAFTVNSGKVYTDAINGSVVKEIASNAAGGGGTDPNVALIKAVTDKLQFTAGGRLKAHTVNPAP